MKEEWKAGRGCAAGTSRPAHLVLGTVEVLNGDHWFGVQVKIPELGPHRLVLKTKLCPPLRCRFVRSF